MSADAPATGGSGASDPSDPNRRAGLGQRTARAAMWNVATFALGRVILLVTTIATARLLEPEDFGLLGLAFTITTFLDLLNDFGLTTAYVYFTRRDSDNPATADTAFTLNMIVGVALTALTVAVAPLAAAFYDESQLTLILVVLASNYLIVSVGAIHDGRLRARLDFKRRFVAELGRSTTKGIVTIALAATGFGVWSLVLGQVVGVCASSLLFVLLERWRPRLRLDRALAGAMARYGWQLVALGFIGLAAANVDFVFVGRRLGTEALGFYTLAFRLPSLAIKGTSSMVGQVAFSAYAKVADDLPTLRRAVLVSLRTLAAYTIPISLGMAVVAPELVVVLFGEKWETTGSLLRILALHSLLTSVMFSAGDAYKAIGRPGLLTLHATIKLAAAVPLLWFAAGIDLDAVAWAQVAVGVVSLATQLALLRHVLAVSPVTAIGSMGAPLAAGALMAGAAFGIDVALDTQADLVRLVSTVAGGVVVYAVALWNLDRDGTRQILGLVLPDKLARRFGGAD